MRTGNEIEKDFYNAVVSHTTLVDDGETDPTKKVSINGGVYRDDFRPRDSTKEDVIVRLTAVTSGQVQSGVVTLLIFTPDIIIRGLNGKKKRNTPRLEQLETLAAQAVEEIAAELPDNYTNVMTETGIRSYKDDNEQHFVSCRISFEYYNEQIY